MSGLRFQRERLFSLWATTEYHRGDEAYAVIDEALAAAKAEGAREAVERIRSVLWGNGFSPVSADVMQWIEWRLDEEAAR